MGGGQVQNRSVLILLFFTPPAMSIFQLFVNSVRFAANIRERLVRYTPICHAYVVHPTQTKTNGKTMYLICVQFAADEAFRGSPGKGVQYKL